MSTGGLLLSAAICFVASVVLAIRFPRVWLALILTASVAGLIAAISTLTVGADWEWRSPFQIGGEAMHLRLDGVSALFLALLSFIGGITAIYAHEYWSEREYPASAPRGRAWWSGIVLSMGFVLVCSNGLHFLIAWEIFTICGYFLITLDDTQREVRNAGWLYLAASHAGMVCLFAFFGALAARSGSWDLGPMRERAALAPLFWMALAGFGVKTGFFPLHVWLPSAHANAPSHVSAILSGVAIKMGIYGLVRFSGWLPTPRAAGWVIIGVGAISALFGIAFALAQNDFKRLLAYSSVENIGIILVGLGAAILAASYNGASWGQLALAGALWHVWNHGAFKSLLFFSAGSTLHATGTREMTRLGGLWRLMPATTGLFAIGALAVCGLPPLNGFVSEWLVYLALFESASTHGIAAWGAIPAAILLGATGAIALATFVKAGAIVFLGAPRTKAAEHAHESGPLMVGSMAAGALMCLCIGLAPILLWPAISRATGSWRSIWPNAAAPASLATLGSLHLSLAFIFLGGAAWLWRKASINGLQRAFTWDCGYAKPRATMQYTSGSFAGIAGGWFNWLLRPQRAFKRPRGPLPQNARRVERVPETVLERGIGPLAGWIMEASNVARRLQHGRLQSYILYVVLGLIGIGAIALFGGAQ